MEFTIKIIVSALIIAGVSELARRFISYHGGARFNPGRLGGRKARQRTPGAHGRRYPLRAALFHGAEHDRGAGSICAFWRGERLESGTASAGGACRAPGRFQLGVKERISFRGARLSDSAYVRHGTTGRHRAEPAVRGHPHSATLFGAALAGFLELIKEPLGAVSSERVQPVSLPFLDGESNGQSVGLERLGLKLHFAPPVRIQLADMPY